MKIGIIGAMHQEVDKLIAEMHCRQQTVKGKRTFYEGSLYGKQVVLVFSRWGKVAASTTVTQLIVEFGVDCVIFSGIAGALSSQLAIGDVVIGHKLYQHDMDASPMMPRFEIPLIGKSYFETDKVLIETAKQSVVNLLKHETAFVQKLQDFGVKKPKVTVGDIASGDKFVHCKQEKEAIIQALPTVFCVEMEGAAVAQVCYDFDVSFLVIRIISDTADDTAVEDFPVFLENIASEYAHYILKELLPKL
ncbi:MAG: 5'-methylthioadenosine/adenosylhomocysteine nucleosidase [Paludibacteraceae bacterium]|nr:5'-methylthioadenosine/adenosylhomocysteine nucleosidase [Paludibacteraceae bacterium]